MKVQVLLTLVVAKTMKNNVVERVYDREATVFGRWRVDNESSLQTLVREDLKFWKAAKFVKVDEDVSFHIC